MTPDSISRAIAGCQAWLARQDEPEAAIAAHEAGVATSPEDAERWVARLLHEQDVAGSWEGDLFATAHSLVTLRELREAAGLKEQDPGIGRGFDWIRARRGVEGAWTDGCSPERHDRGLCHHFLGGFFSVGPPEVPCKPARLLSGAPVETDAEIRFVASATALRALLRWEQGGRDAALHLEGLRRVVDQWEDGPPDGLTITGLLAAVHTLLHSGAEADRRTAEHGLRLLGGKQRGDGSWVETDAFQALEVIGVAMDAGIEPERTRGALWHGARLLVSTQQRDGSWGVQRGGRRALIAWRTFRRVQPQQG